jgi:hypothetical protein
MTDIAATLGKTQRSAASAAALNEPLHAKLAASDERPLLHECDGQQVLNAGRISATLQTA